MAECISTADKLLLRIIQHPKLTSIRRLVEKFIEQGANWSDFTAALRLNNEMEETKYSHIVMEHSTEDGIQYGAWSIEYAYTPRTTWKL